MSNLMLAHTRHRNTRAIVRTRGTVDWQITNNNINTTTLDLRAWKKRTLDLIHKRVASKTFSPECKAGAPVKACMTPQEWKQNLWIMQEWDRFVARWRDLVDHADIDDDDVHDYAAELELHRKEWIALGGSLPSPLPNKPMPGDPKPGEGGIPWTGILIVGALVAVASIVRALS